MNNQINRPDSGTVQIPAAPPANGQHPEDYTQPFATVNAPWNQEAFEAASAVAGCRIEVLKDLRLSAARHSSCRRARAEFRVRVLTQLADSILDLARAEDAALADLPPVPGIVADVDLLESLRSGLVRTVQSNQRLAIAKCDNAADARNTQAFVLRRFSLELAALAREADMPDDDIARAEDRIAGALHEDLLAPVPQPV